MHTLSRFAQTLIALVLTIASFGLSQASAATGVNIQTFSPPANATYTFTESATPGFGFGDKKVEQRWFFGLDYNYLKSPLVVLNADRTERQSVIIDDVQTLDPQIGVQATQWMSLHATIPFHLVKATGKADEFSLGDARIFAKLYAPSDWLPFRLALIPALTMPTGDTTLFTSNGSAGLGIGLAAEKDFGGLLLALNLGYRHTSDAVFSEIDYRQLIPFSIGLNIPFNEKWAMNAEFTGSVVIPSSKTQNPSDFYLGARCKISNQIVAHLGASAGKISGPGSDDYRILAGLRFSPFSEKPAEQPVIAPAMPAPVPPAPAKKRVVFTPKEIQISEEVKFENNSDVLTLSAKNLLDEVAQVIKDNRSSFKMISIEGHTNRIGSVPHNLKLSKARAKAVKEYLSSRGIDPKVLKSEGYGKSRPKQGLEGLSDEARLAADRRVEFKVIK